MGVPRVYHAPRERVLEKAVEVNTVLGRFTRIRGEPWAVQPAESARALELGAEFETIGPDPLLRQGKVIDGRKRRRDEPDREARAQRADQASPGGYGADGHDGTGASAALRNPEGGHAEAPDQHGARGGRGLPALPPTRWELEARIEERGWGHSVLPCGEHFIAFVRRGEAEGGSFLACASRDTPVESLSEALAYAVDRVERAPGASPLELFE
jgi:hypothetical protein